MIITDNDGLELILEDFRDGFDSGWIDGYYVTAAYPKYAQARTQTTIEREAALRAVSTALIETLIKHGVPRADATVYIARHEYFVRRNMNEVDDLPVREVPWLRSWGPPRWRHREAIKRLWNDEARHD